jgi:hypothetical protein
MYSSENTPWQEPSEELEPVQFDVPFQMGKNAYNFIEIDGGYVILGDTGLDFDEFFVVDACFMDLCDRGYGGLSSESPIRYTLTGEPRERILTIEWRNHGYYGEWFHINATEDYGNLKIILDEGMQQVHVHYGPHAIKRKALSLQGYPGYSVYVGEGDDMTFYGSNLAGEPEAPSLHEIELDTFLNNIPPDSTFYTFTIGQPLASVEEAPFQRLKVYPNPAKSIIHIPGANEKSLVVLLDASGRKVFSNYCRANGTVHFGNLKEGFYVLQVLEKDVIRSTRLLIQP